MSDVERTISMWRPPNHNCPPHSIVKVDQGDLQWHGTSKLLAQGVSFIDENVHLENCIDLAVKSDQRG